MTEMEWLYRLESDLDGYRKLLDQHAGSLPFAAHTLASRRNRAWGYAHSHPSPTDLRAAAMEIATRTRLIDIVPTAEALAQICSTLPPLED